MFIQFDKNKLHLQVVVGTLEKYEPSDKIKELQQKLVDLKAQVEKFQNEVVFPVISELEKEIKQENDKYLQ